ncbi:NAD(P)-dependent oxidoreductase [Alginatibacterium sediminis]|uniref:NAD(P)-dependent oxidoreductase n=1 Tax=Alginatibacterium sediminis TaxID=2164068 RepID=A0A420EH32_9ALTE|nr:NAD(P)-binding oxidoreductase [Alginatibacterium sediminis]RKF19999.1 NAD(P)-dependent oxidoreductase [Alginatibacterium sediminis]
MRTLIVGASGATGSRLINAMLTKQQAIRIVIRPSSIVKTHILDNPLVDVVYGEVLRFNEQQMTSLVRGCDAIVSCLGHNMTFKGMYGGPRQLVTDSCAALVKAVELLKPQKSVKFVLMNTSGNRNKLAGETVSLAHRLMIAVIRKLVPPHADNENAANYLQANLGIQNNYIQWVVVRPDSLTDEDSVSPYELYESPVRDALFDAGKTSRINVANFMYRLINEPELWQKWKFQMPLIYNAGQ